MKNLLLIVLYSVLSLLTANVINIPDDQPTIQAGIDIAVEGDTIFVSPGTYYENIEIFQKNDIHIIGSGANVTTIDGNENGHVVNFNIASGSICEFSITNSGDDPLSSCGIFMSQSTTLIESNIIENNCRGISVSSFSEAQIFNNEIVHNIGFRTILITSSIADISYNLVADNLYSGIYNDVWSTITILNNTIVGSNNHIGITINATEQQIVRNNIICDFQYGIFVLGDQQSTVPFVDIAYNDVWDNSIADYWEEYGPLSNIYSQPFLPQPGTGEIHEDPFFVDPFYGDYNLLSTSPCIDAGDPNMPFDPDGTVSDIGAFYYHQNVDSYNYEILNSQVTLMNYPNPFNPLTKIEFSVNNDSNIDLSIYNLKGQKIKTLTNKEISKGNHSIIWNGDDEFGNSVGSGIYFYNLKTNGKTEAVKKCLLLK